MLTFNEWGEQVREQLAVLETAANKHALYLNIEAAGRLLDDGEYPTVLAMLQGVCEGLQAVPEAFAEAAHVCEIVKKYPHEESQ